MIIENDLIECIYMGISSYESTVQKNPVFISPLQSSSNDFSAVQFSVIVDLVMKLQLTEKLSC